MANETQKPVIHQNGRILPTRKKKIAPEKIVVHQRGRTVQKARPVTRNVKHQHLIVQNNKAVHGKPEDVRVYNKTAPKKRGIEVDKVSVNLDADFDNGLYEARVQEFTNSSKEELLDLYNKIDKILPEDKKALILVMKNRGIEVDEAGLESEEDFDKEAYGNSLTMFGKMPEGKIKQLYTKIKNLIPEEQRALKETIAERKIKV